MLDDISFEDFVDNCRHSLQNYYMCHFDVDYFVDTIYDESCSFEDFWQSHIKATNQWGSSIYNYAPNYERMAEIMWESSRDWEMHYCNHCSEYVFTHNECSGECDPDLHWEEPSRDEQIGHLADFLQEVEFTPDDNCIEEYIRTYIFEERLSVINGLIPSGLREDIEALLESEPDQVCYDSIMWVHHVMSLYHASGNILDDYGDICIGIVDDIRENGLEKYFAEDLEELIAEAI